MRIALVTSTFLPRFIGGRERHVYGLAKALVRKGHEVYVVTGDNLRSLQSEVISDSFIIYRIPFIAEIRLPGKGDFIPYRIVNPTLFFKILSKIDADIIHAHDIRHFTSDLAAFYSFLVSKPFILTVHGFFYKPSSFTKIALAIHDLTFNMFSLRIAKKIITVSKTLVRHPLTLFRHKIVYIPNAIDLDEISLALSNSKCNDVRVKYGIPKDVHLILSIGRVTYQKGFDILLKAWKILLAQHPQMQAKLLIIGPIQDIEYYNKLIELINNEEMNKTVLFTGKIPQEDLYCLYREASCIVIASRDEGLPTVLLEAIAFEKPIVASAVGAIPEILKLGGSIAGLIIEKENPQQLAKAIYEIIANDELRRAISLNVAKLKYLFSWDNVIRYVIAIYEEVLKR
jgi:glycosyltransferase involved in cell wall biosynthesis